MNQTKAAVVKELSNFVSEITGVQLGERQSFMVETRLRKRMMDLGIHQEEDYLSYLRENLTTEKEALVSLLTTHHTAFFREFAHFEYIERECLPVVIQSLQRRNETELKVWSAACSTGQEVYTLSMFLKYTLKRIAPPHFTYSIIGSDVSSESIGIAKNGVYSRKDTKEIPLQFLGDHWAKGTGEISQFVKAKGSIKDHCSFEVLNLLDLTNALPAKTFDLIFCRNVFIYFTPAQIKKITEQLMRRMHPQSYLFIGISESLTSLNLNLVSSGPSVYSLQKIPQPATMPLATHTLQNGEGAKVIPMLLPRFLPRPTLLRVLCVDDSPSILTLMKQILKKENGFEIVGTASNGLEAAKMITQCKPDVVTLDIHMPEQDGISYLKSAMTPFHPPVVMVSSVSRESSSLALKALELGAADYVEKPTLASLPERGDEIRIKLNYAFKAWKEGQIRTNLSLDHAFSNMPTISHPENKLRVIIGSIQNRAQIKKLILELTSNQPPILILIEGFNGVLASLAEQIEIEWKKSIHLINEWPTQTLPNHLYLGDFSTYWSSIQLSEQKKFTSILIFGSVTKDAVQKAFSFRNAQILLEDTHSDPVATGASDVVPSSSFAYMSSEFLGKAS